MKRLLIPLAAMLLLGGFASVAVAGDYHVGTSLICQDCHVAHGSMAHDYSVGAFPPMVPIGSAAPYEYLLRNEVNELCLTCHNGASFAPDVFGMNTGVAGHRLAGGLNSGDVAKLANDAGFEAIDGHTLWSTDVAPGGTFAEGGGLHCTNCHAQHGIATQYRNLLNRSSFSGKNVTYAVGVNDLTKDVYERSATAYTSADVDYNEPNTTNSAYGNWCGTCHTDFHGQGGAANMGAQSGGQSVAGGEPWLRHPVADANIGSYATHISSLARFNSRVNRVKVMDSQGLWDGTTADNTVTPSCMSCHKSHGNKNGFGLIYLIGDGVNPVTEEGDGGLYKDLCRQCHTQGG
jgi:hypothetical protein